MLAKQRWIAFLHLSRTRFATWRIWPKSNALSMQCSQMVAYPRSPKACGHRLARGVALCDPSTLASIEHRLSVEYSTSGLGSLNPLITTLPNELALEFMQIAEGLLSPLRTRASVWDVCADLLLPQCHPANGQTR